MITLPKLTIKIHDGTTSDLYTLELRVEGRAHFNELPHTVRLDGTLRSRMLEHISEGSLEAAGRLLGDALFEVEWLRSALNRAFSDNPGLRVVLDIASARLRELHWELLALPSLPKAPLGKTTRYSLSRYLRLDHTEAWPIKHPSVRPTVLVVVAQAPGMPMIPSERFCTTIERAFGPSVRLEVLRGPDTWQQINGRLIELQPEFAPSMVFLIAHGLSPAGGEPALLFEGSAGENRHDRVRVHDLADLFRGQDTPPQFIALIACFSASSNLTGGRSLAEELATTGVPAVLGFEREIAQDTALIFLEMLCKKLAAGEALDRAVTAARVAVQRTPDWWRPVLWTVRPELVLCPAQQPDAVAPSDQRAELVRPQAPAYMLLDEQGFDLDDLRKHCKRLWRQCSSELLVISLATSSRLLVENIARWLVDETGRDSPMNRLAPADLKYTTAERQMALLEDYLRRRGKWHTFYALMVEDEVGLATFLDFHRKHGARAGDGGRMTLIVGIEPVLAAEPVDGASLEVQRAPDHFDDDDVSVWLGDVRRQLHLSHTLVDSWEQLIKRSCETERGTSALSIDQVYHHLREVQRFLGQHAGSAPVEALLGRFIAERLPYA